MYTQSLRSSTQSISYVIFVTMLSLLLTLGILLYTPTVIFVVTLLGKCLHRLSTEAQNQITKATPLSERKEAIQNM